LLGVLFARTRNSPDSLLPNRLPVVYDCKIPPTDDDEGNSYRWQFSLLLEDSQGDTIPVTVAHEDAMNLLQLTPDK